MLILFLCILINALIGVIFKYFKVFGVKNSEAILINYLTCVVCGIVYLSEPDFVLKVWSQPWLLFALLLGMLFVYIFNTYAAAVQTAGIGMATIFQKISLLAPVIVAFVWYGEAVTPIKILGITASLIALYLLSVHRRTGDEAHLAVGFRLLIIVFLGSCAIDLTLFLTEAEQLAPGGDVRYVTAIFFFAFLFGIVYRFFTQGPKAFGFESKSLTAGFLLGLPNFFSIYLLLKLLALGWDGSVVFPVNNVGVLALASLLGVFLFKEEVTFRKTAGFSLAVLSILLLAF